MDRRLWLISMVLLVSCTSAWDRHQRQLAEREASGEYRAALREVRWSIDNTFYKGPAEEQTSAAEASRYLKLASLARQAGLVQTAVQALRDALAADPYQAPAVRTEIERLPVTAADRDRLLREFAWNATALDPKLGTVLVPENNSHCWPYQVREVRVRNRLVVKTDRGMERRATYDFRWWVFDPNEGGWRGDAEWVEDAGSEAELVAGPQQPRYQALTAADHHFYTEERVPLCHRAQWRGPFDTNGTVFVAAQLPPVSPP